MEGRDLTPIEAIAPPPPGDAIRQIVQVFQDGYRAAAALRRTSNAMTATEIECELNAIEVQMLQEISTICGDYLSDYLMDLPGLPRH